MTAVRYATITSILGPEQEVKINITGKYVMVYEASHNDFKARFGDNGQLQPWAKGIVIGDREDPVPFEEMTLVNTSVDEVLTITLAYGHGQIRDARTAFTGGNMPVVFEGTQPVNVQNFPATAPLNFDGTQPVAVQNFPVTQTVSFAHIARLEDSFTKLTEIVATLASPSGRLSKGFVDLTGASYAFCDNNTVVLAAAGANINGVIIHRFSGENLSATRQSALYYDGKPITNISPSEKSTSQFVENFFLPAGKEVKIVSVGPYQRGYCWYEVLDV